jgi:hypothetical protein
MSAPWDDIKARLARGDAVGVDDIVAALAAGPPPPKLPRLVAAPTPRRRGRKQTWSDSDVRAIDTLCQRIRFWSETYTTDPETMTCAPTSWEEIYARVGRALRDPIDARSVQALLRRRRGSLRGMCLVPDADMLAVLKLAD